MAIMDFCEGMSKPFVENTSVYSVYVSGAEIKMAKIPAMALRNNDTQEDIYRLVSHYFTSELTSTNILRTKRDMGCQLQLKYGTVYYTADKLEAEKYAKTERDKIIATKQGQIDKLKAELDVLSNSKCEFE